MLVAGHEEVEDHTALFEKRWRPYEINDLGNAIDSGRIRTQELMMLNSGLELLKHCVGSKIPSVS